MALAPDDIEGRTFTISELGYERSEVHAFLAEVASVVLHVQHLADHHIRRAALAEADAHLRIEALRRHLADALATIDGDGASTVLDLTGNEPVVRTAPAPAPAAFFGDGPLPDRVGVDPVDDLVRRAVALAADAARVAHPDGDGAQLAGSAAPSVH